MKERCKFLRKVLLILPLVVVLGPAVIAQDTAGRCQKLDESIRFFRGSKATKEMLLAVSDRLKFYKDALIRVHAAVKDKLVLDGLGAIIQQLDPAVLDNPQIGGRPKLTIKELLAFQERLDKVLDEAVYWAADFEKGDKDESFHRRMLQEFKDKLAAAQKEFDSLGCVATPKPITEADPTPKEADPTPKEACKITGGWVQYASGIGASTWNVTADGTATEAGLGASTGTARLAGNVMTIEWSHKNGWSGTYSWTMDAACKKGTGQLVFKSGGSGTYASSVTHN